MIVYVETSAAAKLLKREPESAVVREFIAQLIDTNLPFLSQLFQSLKPKYVELKTTARKIRSNLFSLSTQ
jgi:hypothetical protein